MALSVEIPGRDNLELEHLLLDQNGTLSDRGELIEGVAERLSTLKQRLSPQILTADTFGTLEELKRRLGVQGRRVATGMDKLAFLQELGGERCVAIGNGRNDVEMLTAAALGIAVIGPEGASSEAIAAADVVCGSVIAALDLLVDEQVLIATLRV